MSEPLEPQPTPGANEVTLARGASAEDLRVARRKIGRQLRMAREAAGLSQDQAARALGVTQATISRFESGDRGVEAAELPQFARVYGQDAGWLLDDA